LKWQCLVTTLLSKPWNTWKHPEKEAHSQVQNSIAAPNTLEVILPSHTHKPKTSTTTSNIYFKPIIIDFPLTPDIHKSKITLQLSQLQSYWNDLSASLTLALSYTHKSELFHLLLPQIHSTSISTYTTHIFTIPLQCQIPRTYWKLSVVLPPNTQRQTSIATPNTPNSLWIFFFLTPIQLVTLLTLYVCVLKLRLHVLQTHIPPHTHAYISERWPKTAKIRLFYRNLREEKLSFQPHQPGGNLF